MEEKAKTNIDNEKNGNSKILGQFDLFIKAIDERVVELINSKEDKLTKHISRIQWELWKNYKEINGTSAGFHGISEYIVFSVFKNFIEYLNTPQKFKPKRINDDLRFFELEKNCKSLRIYRSTRLKHIEHLSLKSKRAPDIVIVKKEGDSSKLIVVIEIKNYLDKGRINSAIDMLSQIRNDCNTKYAVFSFNRIFINDKETIKKLKKFQKNNFLVTLTNEDSNNLSKEIGILSLQCKISEDKFEITDLSEFFNKIRGDLIIENIKIGE